MLTSSISVFHRNSHDWVAVGGDRTKKVAVDGTSVFIMEDVRIRNLIRQLFVSVTLPRTNI